MRIVLRKERRVHDYIRALGIELDKKEIGLNWSWKFEDMLIIDIAKLDSL